MYQQTNNNNHTFTTKRKILYILSFAEFWDNVNFFGTVAVLVLYATKVFLLPDQLSYSIYGIYLVLFCSLPVLGGLLADKLFGYLPAIIVGALILIVGNLCLVLQNLYFLYFGLAATICGTALYKPTCTSLVGTIYHNESDKQDKAYTFFYAIMNCGAIVGPIVYGTIAKFFGWHICFMFSAIGITSCLFVFIINRKYFDVLCKKNDSKKTSRKLLSYLWLIIICAAVTGVFFLANDINYILSIFAISVIIFLWHLLARQTQTEKRRLLGILVLLGFCMFFFAASLQVGSSLTLFLDRSVNKTLLGWNIPTTFFTSLDPLFVVLSAPVFSVIWNFSEKKGKNPSVTLKLLLGLIIGSVGFLWFWLSAQLNVLGYHYVVLMLILCGYIFIGAGEMCLTPAVLTAINNYAPKKIVNTVTGFWYLQMAFAGYLGSMIAKFGSYIDFSKYSHVHYISNAGNFSHIFITVALITIAATAILFLCKGMINGMFALQVENE